MEDYKYTDKGKTGETCGECVHFRPSPETPESGICFGREVSIGGTCGFFKERG